MSRGELSKNDISPYILLLYVGFFSILFLIVGYTIYSLVTRKDLSFIFECFDFSEVGSGLKLFFYFWELLFLALFSKLLLFLSYTIFPKLYLW